MATFDTLCSTWRETPFEGPNDTVDLLLNNLLEDIWLQCERLFKQSAMPAVHMKFATDHFCLHVMNQLISTHNRLYDIRRKSQETLCQETCTDKALSMHDFTEVSNQDISKMSQPIEHEKNSRQLVSPDHSYQNQQSSKCLDQLGTKEGSDHGSNKIEITGNIPLGHRSIILKPFRYKSKMALPSFLDERNSRFSILRFLPKRISPSYAKKGFAL
jgi:hypothetical protein